MNSFTQNDQTSYPNVQASGDRFIPSRCAMDLEVSNFNLTNENQHPNIIQQGSPSKQYAKQVADSLFDDGLSSSKVLAFKNKAPAPRAGYQNHLRVLYTQNKKDGSQKRPNTIRRIKKEAFYVLDAPNMSDNFYSNLLDWNSNGTLAIALDNSVFLWDSATSDVTELTTLEESDSVTSLSWTADGRYLSLGTSDAEISLWDVSRQRKLRMLPGHHARVGCLSWNEHILSSGSRDTLIMHHDVRMREHVVATLSGHEHEVCGLKWSPDGTQLASGGNDNVVNIWDKKDETPKFSLGAHTAAVKALDWCPWQSHLLATGGGTSDRTIRFWNTSTGSCLNSIETGSQVCSLKWSKTHRELVSSHGYSQNQISVWKYPSLTKVADLNGHDSRVLHLALSPDGETVVSAAADEKLKFWKVWPSRSTSATGVQKKSASSLRRSSKRRINIR